MKVVDERFNYKKVKVSELELLDVFTYVGNNSERITGVKVSPDVRESSVTCLVRSSCGTWMPSVLPCGLLVTRLDATLTIHGEAK